MNEYEDRSNYQQYLKRPQGIDYNNLNKTWLNQARLEHKGGILMHKEDSTKLVDEPEMLHLARTISQQAIGLSNTLPEVLQWRVGSAFQGDVYDMLSSTAAALAAVEVYTKHEELSNARIKAFVIKSALSIVSKDPEILLLKKIDALIALIDVEIKKADANIRTLEEEEQ